MKKKSIRYALFAMLFIGSLASHIFLNSSAASQFPARPNTATTPQTQSDEPDETREIIVPDVTIIQKVIELAGRILSRN